jgi:hypothetical protein
MTSHSVPDLLAIDYTASKGMSRIKRRTDPDVVELGHRLAHRQQKKAMVLERRKKLQLLSSNVNNYMLDK